MSEKIKQHKSENIKSREFENKANQKCDAKCPQMVIKEIFRYESREDALKRHQCCPRRKQ